MLLIVLLILVKIHHFHCLIKDTITITHNLVTFYFKDIAKILLTFMEIKEYIENKIKFL